MNDLGNGIWTGTWSYILAHTTTNLGMDYIPIGVESQMDGK